MEKEFIVTEIVTLKESYTVTATSAAEAKRKVQVRSNDAVLFDIETLKNGAMKAEEVNA